MGTAMSWQLSRNVSLNNDRVPDADAARQQRTASEILRRLREQPGIVLADEVGMGKTYVALAVAASVVEATRRRRPVVVMVPSSVAEKWASEWAVFAERCLSTGHGLRASDPVRRGGELAQLLDQPAQTRRHIIIATHGVLSTKLLDPFIRLALVRQATLWQRDRSSRQRALARHASALLQDRRFDETTTKALLEAPLGQWGQVWIRHRPEDPLEAQPLPFVDRLSTAFRTVDLGPLREAVATIPLRQSANFQSRLQQSRRNLTSQLKQTWKDVLGALDLQLPLLILDEAHHVKNPTQLAGLFANPAAEQDAKALQGPLGNMFNRMLFLTATPFQLGHNELLRVLDRFHGVRWSTSRARERFVKQTGELRSALDRAQGAALRFERAWDRIDSADAGWVTDLDGFTANSEHPETVRTALTIGAEAQEATRTAEQLLRPWVIRHVNPRKDRRLHQPGRAIIDHDDADRGLAVAPKAALPFLLAARAQALASLHGTPGKSATRPYYAYGLASSFEAYADTRRNRVATLDDQAGEQPQPDDVSPQLVWYLDRIRAALPESSVDAWGEHPKVAATVERVAKLWSDGEKVVVFCFYVETGRALRAHISRALRREVVVRAATALDMDTDADEVFAALDRIGERLLRSDTRGYQAFRQHIEGLTPELDATDQQAIAEVAIRFMRTPSFLVRFVDLSPDVTVDDLLAGFEHADTSGTTLGGKVRALAGTLHETVDHERQALLAALRNIQTGAIHATAEDFDRSERASHRESLLPNVRLANGGVRAETRQRLMLAFNSPFFPEVLVASAVMAEGIDLHRNCRHVIHHDLDWNPSTLEQRTGRVDRIGSKSEFCQEPVVIYEPYIGGTHDEKMFRVVKDRARWFGVVMGDATDANERRTEARESRVPLPDRLATSVTMDMSIRS